MIQRTDRGYVLKSSTKSGQSGSAHKPKKSEPANKKEKSNWEKNKRKWHQNRRLFGHDRTTGQDQEATYTGAGAEGGYGGDGTDGYGGISM